MTSRLKLAGWFRAAARRAPLSACSAILATGVLLASWIAGARAATEWTNALGSADWNIAGNWSNALPSASSGALLSNTGAATTGGLNISAAGAHTVQSITVNNTSGNYTIGTAAHQGSFSLGASGGIEVDSAGQTVNNCDASATSQLSFHVVNATTVLKQVGDVSGPTITVDGLGKLQLTSSSVSFSTLQANGGTTEFTQSLMTPSNVQIGSGGTVQFDSPSTLSSPSTVSISAGGTLTLQAKNNTFGGPIDNSGNIHLTGASTASFNGVVSNAGSWTLDSGTFGIVTQPYSSNGSITNNGTLAFTDNFTSTQGAAGSGTNVFNQQVSTGAGATALLNFGGNVNLASSAHWTARLTGPARGSQYDALNVGNKLILGGALTVSLGSGFAPSLGQSFDLANWSTISGTFPSATLPALGSTLAWSTLFFPQDGAIAVVNKDLIPGDVNHDFQVTVADISALMGALTNLTSYKISRGLTGPTANSQLIQIADVNGDGHVNNLDIQQLISLEASNMFGSLAIGGAVPGSNLVPVPEPATVFLLAIGGFLLIAAARSPVLLKF